MDGCIYSTYIVRCADNSYYTGMTKDLKKRIEAHNGINNNKSGAKYTRARRPVELVFEYNKLTYKQADRLERHIKKMSRKNKTYLVERDTVSLEKLSDFIDNNPIS